MPEHDCCGGLMTIIQSAWSSKGSERSSGAEIYSQKLDEASKLRGAHGEAHRKIQELKLRLKELQGFEP